MKHKVQLIVNAGSNKRAQFVHYIEPITAVLKYCGMHEIRSLVNRGVHSGMNAEAATAALEKAFTTGMTFGETTCADRS